MRNMLRWLAVGAAVFILVAPSQAAVDGEVELRYWNAEFKESVPGDSRTADSPGADLRAEIVLIEKLAIAGDYFRLEGEDFIEDATFSQFTLDVKWRVIAPTKNTFFGVGLGYQGIRASDDETISSNGFRIVADGRFGFAKILYVYGRFAFLPSLGDLKEGGQSVLDGRDGYDLDFGLGITPIPLLTLWVGYRTQDLGFEAPEGGQNVSWEQSGPYLGAGIRF